MINSLLKDGHINLAKYTTKMNAKFVNICFGLIIAIFSFGCDLLNYIILFNDTDNNYSIIVKADYSDKCDKTFLLDSLFIYKIDSLGNFNQLDSTISSFTEADSTSFSFKIPKNMAVRIGGCRWPIRKVIISTPYSSDTLKYAGNIKSLRGNEIILKGMKVDNLSVIKLSKVVTIR